MPIGRPSITTPNRPPADAATLRAWQQAINNIRERFRAVEELAQTVETTGNARATSVATLVSSLQASVREILAILSRLQNLPPISDGPANDGDVLTWSDDSGQYVPETPDAPDGGIYMPVVLGDIPPTLVYLPDGNLVYARVE